MILTCPSCGTQYVVKDGAIPPHGRQVRCASCKHSWHQDPEPVEAGDAGEAEPEQSLGEAAMIDPATGPEAEERAYEEAALAEVTAVDEAVDGAVDGAVDEAPHEPSAGLDEPAPDEGDETVPPGYAPIDPVTATDEPLVEPEESAVAVEQVEPVEPVEPVEQQRWTPRQSLEDDDFSPFAYRDADEPAPRSPLLKVLLAVLLIAAIAAAFWFLAPAEWKQRIGIAGPGETPLQLMMTHSDRQKLASGNELLAVSGRVINPTDESQDVPPIQAQLRSATGQLVYSWTIPPPAPTLPPGASAPFNSAEVNVPAGGDELTITLGPTRT